MAKLSLSALRAGAAPAAAPEDAPDAGVDPNDAERASFQRELRGILARGAVRNATLDDALAASPQLGTAPVPGPGAPAPRLSLTALRRRAAALPAAAPGPGFSGGGATAPVDTSGAAPAPLSASPDVMRALRLGRMLEDQGRAMGDYTAAGAFVKAAERQDPGHPMLEVMHRQVEEQRPYASTVLTDTERAAVERELARTGRAQAADAARRGPNPDPLGPLKYPLRAVAALVRPIDTPLPAYLLARKRGMDPSVAVPAAMDPLGRFSPTGQNTGAFTNAPPSWHDVLEAYSPSAAARPALATGHEVTPQVDPLGLPLHPLSGPGATPAPSFGRAAAGLALDIGASPSTYLTAGAGRIPVSVASDAAQWGALRAGSRAALTEDAIRLAGRTVVPGRAVTAAARFPGSALQAGADALAGRLTGEAAARASRAGEVLGAIGPAQALEGVPRVVGAIPTGGGKTVGSLVGEAFNRYHAIDQVKDPALRAKLREIAQFRESATSAQTGDWTAKLEQLLRDVPLEQQRRVRDMIENPGAFDWNLPEREPMQRPPEAIVPVEPGAVPGRPPMAGDRVYSREADEPLYANVERTPGDLGDAARWEEWRRASNDATIVAWTYGENSPQAAAAKTRAQAMRDALGPYPARTPEEAVRFNRLRNAVSLPDEPLSAPAAAPPYSPASPPLGAPQGVPYEPAERFAGSGRTSGAASTMFGQPAAPTAVPGTPDAARYGAIPNHLSGQVPTVAPLEAELVARIEHALRQTREALTQRGLLPTGGRENYFPRERTIESLRQQKGLEAKAEALGRGVDPRLRTRFGFRDRREEHAWINELIERVNAQEARDAAKKGLPAPEPIPAVEDTTSAVNAFWKRVPESVRLRSRLVPEPERFLDSPKDALQRYFVRATRAVNDADAIKAIEGIDGLPRSFVREARNGTVFEPYEVPVGGEYATGTPPPQGMADSVRRAPPDAPRLGAGTTGARGEAMTGPPPRPVVGELGGEVPPGGAAAFQGKSPFDPAMSRTEREIPGYVYPKNPAWREAFPGRALPRDVATYIDAFGKPYWANEGFAGLIDQLVVRPLHKLQLPWKVSATSGAGLRFATRNYMSQQVMNLDAYGARAFAPAIQQESHLLALPDAIFDASPGLYNRKITVNGQTYTARELREAARQTGLWRTTPEAVINATSAVDVPAAHSTAVMGWKEPTAQATAILGAAERGATGAARAIGPVNPWSKDFVATKYAFHPVAEYGERQGRMAALLLELGQGKRLVEAAQDAARTHVNYQTFAPAFEKYGTLAYPFAKFAVGETPRQVEWALRYPGRSMLTERIMRAGEHMAPQEDRERYAREPHSDLIEQGAGRLVGWPGRGVLKEPEAGRATGPGRLPFVSMPPTADVLINALGAPARIASARSQGAAAASEVLENAFPAFKVPYELATGRNVFTGEPIDVNAPQPAPRLVAALYAKNPELARRAFRAVPVTDRQTGQSYLATPTWVNLITRYYPNVGAADLAAAFIGGGKKPYDNPTAIALRLAGITQILHDPLIPASQEARESAKLAKELRARMQEWIPSPPSKP